MKTDKRSLSADSFRQPELGELSFELRRAREVSAELQQSIVGTIPLNAEVLSMTVSTNPEGREILTIKYAIPVTPDGQSPHSDSPDAS